MPKKILSVPNYLSLPVAGIEICNKSVKYIEFINKNGIFNFLFHDHTPVANLGGRLGAALSHVLVYKGAGIASLVIGMAIGGLGLVLQD